MPKYKVGDVAALFPKPKESTTESGKKLQALFSEFHAKRNKPPLEDQTQHNTKLKAERRNFKNKDKEFSNLQSLLTERNKKRKFSFDDVESNIKKVMKKINSKLDGPIQTEAVKVKERKKNSSLSEIDFPRSKNKRRKFNLNFEGGETEGSPTNQINNFDKTSKVSGYQTVTEDSFINQKNKFNKTSEVNAPNRVKGFIKKAKLENRGVSNKVIKYFETADTENLQHAVKVKKRGKNNSLPEIDFPRSQKKGRKFNLNFESGETEDSSTNQINKFNKTSKASGYQTVTKDSSINQKNKFNKTSGVNVPYHVKGFIKKANHENRGVSDKVIKYFETADTENLQHAVKVKEMGKNSSLPEIDFPRSKKKGRKFNLNFESGETEDSSTNQINKFDKTLKVSGYQTVTEDSSLNQKYKFNKRSEENAPNHVKGFIKKAKNENRGVSNKVIKYSETDDTENLQHTSKINYPQQVKGFLKKAKHENRSVPNKVIKHFETADTENTHILKYEMANNNSLLEIKNENVKNQVKKPKKKKLKNAANKKQEMSNKLEFINAPDVEKDLDSDKLTDTKQEDDEETLSRTLFVGNLLPNIKRKALIKLFSAFGQVERIRCQTIETDVKKIFQRDHRFKFPPNYAATSIPAFIIFKEKESAVNALSLNGSMFKNRHITVDFALPTGTKKVYDLKRSIFIGNLPFGVEDENIWNTFSQCGKIESVRLIRDKGTGIGKGFGYVLFSDVQSKGKALALENVKIEERTIRIQNMQTDKKAQKRSNKDPVDNKNIDPFKSRAIKFKQSHQDTSSRKSVKKIMKKNKALHDKRKIASFLQKKWK